jgi:uncharacterized membrane protein (UPF0127 family)
MRRRRLLALGAASLPAAVAGCLTTESSGEESGDGNEDDHAQTPDAPEEWTEPEWPTGPYAEYGSTILEVHDEDGTVLGRVKAAIAETGDEWWLGLSDAESMPENGGMLFVSESTSDLTFVMRRMSFGLDIVYIGEDRRITSIHHAPEPGPDENGSNQRYPGTGQYVLEVNYMWTSERGISEGDELVF